MCAASKCSVCNILIQFKLHVAGEQSCRTKWGSWQIHVWAGQCEDFSWMSWILKDTFIILLHIINYIVLDLNKPYNYTCLTARVRWTVARQISQNLTDAHKCLNSQPVKQTHDGRVQSTLTAVQHRIYHLINIFSNSVGSSSTWNLMELTRLYF